MPGFKIVEIWGHDWEELKKNTDIDEFIRKEEINLPLNPRASLYGGRTNALKLYHKCAGGEQIKYIDYTSLYPHVMRKCAYPKFHPKIILENFHQKKKYFGLIKVKILPPRGLYIPLLPYRSNGKLMFPLCRTCAEEQQQTCCEHDDEERAITGTYVTLEVEAAEAEGYKVIF
jgi:hypothetical protein